jgi:hypothetical protein
MFKQTPGPYRPPLKIVDYIHLTSSKEFEITLEDGRCYLLRFTYNEAILNDFEEYENADYYVLNIFDAETGVELDEDDEHFQQIVEAANNEGLR